MHYLAVLFAFVIWTQAELEVHLDKLRRLDGYYARTREEAVDAYPTNVSRNLDIWNRYYLCLEKQLEALGSMKVLVPEAISVLEGTNVHMDCRLCLYPGDLLSTADWFWYSTSLPQDEYTVLRKGRLSLFGVRQEEAGLYECRLGATRARPYFLHVVPENEPVREVKPKKAKSGPYPLPPTEIYGDHHRPVKVFTRWNPWTECTRCDSVGRKYRFGTCFVSIFNSTSSKQMQEGHQDSLGILQLFTEGLPCLSPFLPDFLRLRPEVSNRSNEMMTAFCKVPCADDIFEAKDMFGRVLERVNNSAGLFSLLQGPPPLPPLPGRMTVYAPLGLPLTLFCPGHGLSDLPYRWRVGKKARIAPWLAKTKSLNRVSVNSKQELVFSSIQPDDERLYSCWQGPHLSGVVRVLVSEDSAFQVNHHLILFGTILILGTFLYVFARIFMNRKRAASIYY